MGQVGPAFGLGRGGYGLDLRGHPPWPETVHARPLNLDRGRRPRLGTPTCLAIESRSSTRPDLNMAIRSVGFRPRLAP
jgi:hypothetical protein